MFYLSIILCIALGMWYAMAYVTTLYFKAYRWYMFQSPDKFTYLYDYFLPEILTKKSLGELFGVGYFGTYSQKQYRKARKTVYEQGLAYTRHEAALEFVRLFAFLLAVLIISQQLLLGYGVFAAVNAVYIALFRNQFAKVYPLSAAIGIVEYYIITSKKSTAKSISLAEQAIPEPAKELTPKQSIFWISLSNAVIMLIATIGLYLADPKALTKPGYLVLGIALFLFFELIILGVVGVYVLANKLQKMVINKFSRKK